MVETTVTPSKRPADSAFKQQRLKAWQPILTPRTVLPTFFIIGTIFIPLGIGLYITSQNVQELVLDYTSCDQTNIAPTNSAYGLAFNSTSKICNITFSLASAWTGPIFLYYRLTNFYQNHRRYVKSVASEQLRGEAISVSSTAATNCFPLNAINNLMIYPCGLIADSLYNDTISAPAIVGGNTAGQPSWTENGIAWPTDVSVRFQPTSYTASQVVPPPNWGSFNGVKLNGTWPADLLPQVARNEHLMVWMRTAGLPNFRKLYMRTNGDLPAGQYTINVVDIYPVTGFGGTKSIVLSTTSWLGGKNPFLGIAYIVVGSLCLALGFFFLAKHMISPRKLGDHSYLSWNQASSQ